MPKKNEGQPTRQARALLGALVFLLLALPLPACSPSPQAAQSLPASLQAQPEPSTTVDAAATAVATSAVTATATTLITSTATVTATDTITGTPTPRPTPEGPPPADPFEVLDVFDYTPAGSMVIKRDRLPLDGATPENMLLTITDNRLGVLQPLTAEVGSSLVVLTWDPTYREWSVPWQSEPISGTGRLLPAANQISGWNGGNLLGTGEPVLALRTTGIEGGAYMQLYRWNKSTHKGEPLKMVPVGGGAEQDALFRADLDITMSDLDDDGKWEVIADNVSGVQVWAWDGSRYTPKEVR